MRVPSSPPGVSVEENMAVAHHKKNVLKAGSAFIYSWFYTQVRNRGPWDYKKLSAEYEAFGNFNYGATGTAAGFSEDVLLRQQVWPKVEQEQPRQNSGHGGGKPLSATIREISDGSRKG